MYRIPHFIRKWSAFSTPLNRKYTNHFLLVYLTPSLAKGELNKQKWLIRIIVININIFITSLEWHPPVLGPVSELTVTVADLNVPHPLWSSLPFAFIVYFDSFLLLSIWNNEFSYDIFHRCLSAYLKPAFLASSHSYQLTVLKLHNPSNVDSTK